MEVGVRMPPCAGQMGLLAFSAWAAKQGFKAIDVPRPDAEIKKILEDHGLRIGTVDLIAWGTCLSPDPERRKAGLEEQKKYLNAVKELGAKTIFVVWLPEDHSQSRAKSFEHWQESAPALIDLLDSLDLDLATEAWVGPGPGFPSIGCTPEMLRAMIDVVPSPRLGLCFDPSHLVRLGIDYLRFLTEFGSRVRHVHAKDTELLPEQLYLTGHIGPSFGGKYAYGESAWRYTIPGEGTCNWTVIKNRLKDVGYDGLLAVELEDHNYFPAVESQQHGLVNSIRFLERVIA